jgi:hypothetical protein
MAKEFFKFVKEVGCFQGSRIYCARWKFSGIALRKEAKEQKTQVPVAAATRDYNSFLDTTRVTEASEKEDVFFTGSIFSSHPSRKQRGEDGAPGFFVVRRNRKILRFAQDGNSFLDTPRVTEGTGE